MELKPKAMFAMAEGLQHRLFRPDQLHELNEMVHIDVTTTLTSWPVVPTPQLDEVEILITGWGAPMVDESALNQMPSLSALLHTAGTVKHTVTPAVFEAGVTVTTSARANAVPVAEYALAEILLAGKRTLFAEHQYRHKRGRLDLLSDYPSIGNYGSTVGVVSASTIGAMVIELLQPFDVTVLVYDPYASTQQIESLGARHVGLEDLMAASDVVSVHAPLTAETTNLLDARRIGLMPDGATLINTARAPIIDNDALRTELATGRISAVLDVTDPEPLTPDDPLWSMPQVRLTPHLAGSLGNELHRMAASTLEEVRRAVTKNPPQHPVTEGMLATMA